MDLCFSWIYGGVISIGEDKFLFGFTEYGWEYLFFELCTIFFFYRIQKEVKQVVSILYKMV